MRGECACLILNDPGAAADELQHGIVGGEGEDGRMAGQNAPHVAAHV